MCPSPTSEEAVRTEFIHRRIELQLLDPSWYPLDQLWLCILLREMPSDYRDDLARRLLAPKQIHIGHAITAAVALLINQDFANAETVMRRIDPRISHHAKQRLVRNEFWWSVLRKAKGGGSGSFTWTKPPLLEAILMEAAYEYSELPETSAHRTRV